MHFFAAIVDVDGVLTRTASVHEEAWSRLFARVLPARAPGSEAFSHADYLAHVDGKPRLQGLRDFLATRGIDVGDEEAERLAEQKNQIFLQLIDEGGVEVFEDAVFAVESWRRHGLAIAFVSASRNAGHVLRAADLDALCDVRVDGETAARQGLRGKEALFREGARRLGVEAGRAFVIEDAVAGVEAARAAGFGGVIGLARDGEERARALKERGADRVVRRLDELEDLVQRGTRRASGLPWALRFGQIDTRIGDKTPALFLDFDGTLAPIVEHPERAEISDRVQGLVRELAARWPVAIVSGRDCRDVARRVGIEGLWYAGSHGFEITAPDGRRFRPDEARAALAPLRDAEAILRRELGGVAGIELEEKAFALAVHYRRAADNDAESAIRRTVELADTMPNVRVHRDLKVIELRPDLDWDKGKAVREILALSEQDDLKTIPLYLGDGPTDEDAFRTLCDTGIGILVGAPERPTFAQLQLEDQGEVEELLRELLRAADADHDRDVWTLGYREWLPRQEGLREALCTLGNGSFATRGAAEEAVADGIHYPGTYVAGGYDRVATEIQGEVIVNEDLVNWPNWLRLSFRPRGGEWLSLSAFDVLEHVQELDLKRGRLRRRLRVRDRRGRESVLVSRRLVSMDDASLAAIEWELTPLNWFGWIEIRSALDGVVANEGVSRYRQLRNQHLVPESVEAGEEEMIALSVQTRQSRIRMAQAARTRVASLGSRRVYRRGCAVTDRSEQRIEVEARARRPIRLEKVVAVMTSRDPALSEPLGDARERARRAPAFVDLAAAHAMRWAELWRRCDIRLGPGCEDKNRILRLHIFHLLQVISPHISHRDSGVPARGLHGEAYRGHVFWDELFILPVLNLQIPELTRELLMYRYLRLDAARGIARSLGCRGAAFPWQSGSSGREESQTLHLNPNSGRWLRDETLRQRHISAAVAWNVWHYVEVTDDCDFLSSYGAEMLLEIARFWASFAEWDEVTGRCSIRQVVGPDEFHTRYPGSNRPGIDDNAYTNVMASWCLRTAERALDRLDEARRRELLGYLGVRDRERRHWHEVAKTLRVAFHSGHIMSQFDGYAELEELDWEAYRARYGDIHRLDRILEAEDDSPNRYKASKQADVLMLLYLLGDEALIEQLGFMGYELSPEWIADNVEYYLRRTSHGSTLSRMLHSWVLARHDRAHSWRLFEQALRADVDDVQGGTTREGIHLGAMAGTIDLAQRGFTGADVKKGVLWLDPQLPDELPAMMLRLRYQNAWIELEIAEDALEVELIGGDCALARVGIRSEIHELVPGERRRFAIRRGKSLGAEASRPRAT